jgi:hypothetical protein
MPGLPWPRAEAQADGTSRTAWILTFASDVDDARLTALRDNLRHQDPTLRYEVVRTGRDELRLEFTWQAYDAEALSRSALAIALAEEVVGSIASIGGRPRQEWPIGRPPGSTGGGRAV